MNRLKEFLWDIFEDNKEIVSIFVFIIILILGCKLINYLGS